MNKDYVLRINRAIDYIQNNLSKPLNLDTVSEIAAFSKYHFHRIFTNLIGETLNQFILRSRLEYCLYLLSHGSKRNLTEISELCGFTSQAEMSRAFKRRYGCSPGNFNLEGFRNTQRQLFQDRVADPENLHLLDRLPENKNPDGFIVDIEKLPQRRMAYIRVWNPYRMDAVPQAAEQLVEWAKSMGCIDGPYYGYMWEDPELVDPINCRYDVAIEIPPEILTSGEISEVVFPELTIAKLDICGSIDLEQRGLDWLYGQWLPQSQYEPDHHPSFERWDGLPFQHGMEHFELCLQLPITKCR